MCRVLATLEVVWCLQVRCPVATFPKLPAPACLCTQHSYELAMSSVRTDTFGARVIEIGLEDCIPAMKVKGLTAHAKFPFGSEPHTSADRHLGCVDADPQADR